jgi:ABC-type multidrug transport system fused ATPase/permease subunit
MARRRFDDRPKAKLTRGNLKGALQIFKYIRPYMSYFILAMSLLALGSLIFMMIPGVAGELVNTAQGEPKYSFSLNELGLVLLILLVIQALFSYLRTICFAIVSEKGMADVRKDLYNKMISQPILFFEENRVGELTSRITTDVEQLQSVFSITLAEFFRQIIILIVGVGILAYLTPRLALIMLMVVPVVVILAMVFGRYIRKISKKRQDQLANTNTIVEETFQSFSVVKSFTNEWFESLRYGNSINELVSISLRFAKTRGLFFAFIILLLFGSIMFILFQGAVLVQQGEMVAGDLLSFVIYTMVLGGAIASLGNLYTAVAGAIGATERVQQILKEPVEIKINEGKVRKSLKLKGHINFQNLSFSYPTRKDVGVLKNINLEVEPGSKVALVGQSGSGKSTIVKLLMKFYTPDNGDILVDQKNVNDYNLTTYRQNIGIVPQEVILFGGTIRENILYGKPEATEAELLAAAEKSNSLEFIDSFPDRLDTIVGERGVKLSGGQRQRIAIARAILKDPSILILDEATSSLDAKSEQIVQDALDKLMEGRTSVIIAHRLATIKNVDCIYVLDKGEIVEKGTHIELANKNEGTYSQFAKLQFELS